MPEPTQEPSWNSGARKGPAAIARIVLSNDSPHYGVAAAGVQFGGLVRWMQQLPSNPVNVWLAERAADWDRLMHVPPADVLEGAKRLLRVEGS